MAAPGTCSWEGTETDGACVNWSGDGHSSSSSSSHDCGSETDNGETACNVHGGGGACSWNSASGICEDDTTTIVDSGGSSTGCTDGLPVRKFAVQIQNIATGTARTALCDETNVLCGATDIVAKFDVGTTTLSYDASNNWQVKSGGTVVLTAAGYLGSNDYGLVTPVTDLQLVDLVALNTQLDAGATVTNCDTTFNAALDAYTALQRPCEEVGNTNQDLPGACADTCITGYQYLNGACATKAYEEAGGTVEEKAAAKKTHIQNVRKGGAQKRGTETDVEFTKRKFKEMKTNTRAYLKSQFDTAKIANDALPQGQKVKPHVLRKQVRMPLSIAEDSDDFKAALRNKLRDFFNLGSGADRDVGIIVGPENLKADELCADWIPAADFDDANDTIKCITYDAAIDGDTTDVHVLGNDDSYSVGGLLIGGIYEPVVKQTVTNADTETFEVSCWSGADTGWIAQDKDAGAEGTQHWAAGDEVQCTVTKGGVVTVVDTIVGSLTTGQVDGDKCDVGYGCARKSEDPTSADYLVCADTFACELCASPEANNAVDATVCAAQLCAAGTGYDENKGFDPNLDPTNTANTNCHECNVGTYNTGGNGQCVAYGTDTTCSYGGYALNSSHTDKTEDAPCVDVQSPEFTSGATATAIDENSARFQVVYSPTASDNSGDSVTFALRTLNDWENFELERYPTTMVIFKLSPDFEAQSSYSFTVVAIDAAGNEAEQAVTLAINNVADVACTDATDCEGAGTASGFRDSTQGCLCQCPTGYYSEADNGYCFPHTTCGNQEDGATRLTGETAAAAGSCAACDAGTYAGLVTATCAAHTTCGNQTGGASRLIGASTTDAGSCADCAAGTYAANGETTCAAHTTCGNQAGGATRLTGASTTDAGYCADCAADTYATNGQDDCLANTQCGDQVAVSGAAAVTRLNGATREAAGTCDACAADTWAANGQDDCLAHKTCGHAQGADGKAIETAGTLEADTACCDSADNDAICDDVDTCFINGCTNKQLTDAYATLEAAAGSNCENSRRAQDHTKVFETCYTTGCTTEPQKDAMLAKFGTCSA